MDYSPVAGYIAFEKGTKDGTLPTTNRKLIKLRIEWKSKLETDWSFVKEFFKEE